MKLEELKSIIGFDQFSIEAQEALNVFFKYYGSIQGSTREILTKVKEKYKFETIQGHFGSELESESEIHLEFVTGVGLDFTTIICLNMDGNVDNDNEFGKIIEDGWKVNSEFEKIPEEVVDEHFEILERVFYTWLAFLWQDIKGYKTGLKVSIIDGSASQYFSLNDFAWRGISNYLDFEEPPKKVIPPFDSPLSLKEIYMRTGVKK